MSGWLKGLHWPNIVVLLGYGLCLLFFMVRAGSPESISWWFGMFLFFIWCIFPILIPLVIFRKSWFVAITVGLLAIYSIHVYWQGLFGPDVNSTSALIFIFFPLYQSGISLLIMAVYWGYRHLNDKEMSGPQ